MPAELEALRKLRPSVPAPASHAVARAREVLSAEIAAESRAAAPGQRGGSRAPRRWLVPSIVVVVLGAGGLAAAGLSDWWLGADPPVRPDEVAAALDWGGSSAPGASTGEIDAQVELARTVARASGAALVAVPADDGENFCIVRVPDTTEADATCFGGDWADFFTDWIHDSGSSRAWYLLGRVPDPGATRLALFEEVTHPFEEGETAAPAVQPQLADVGPGGFFLARVPESQWPGLDLAYGSISVLDESGAQIRRTCRYLGLSPLSPLALGGRIGPGPLEPGDPDGADRCPPSGSAVQAATFAPVAPRQEDLSALAGRDLVNGGPFRLSSLFGNPVILADLREFALVETATRLLLELESFTRRHPDVQVVALVHSLHHSRTDMRSTAQWLGLGFPVVQASPVLRDARGGWSSFVLALDAGGHVTGELGVPDLDLLTHPLLTQRVLDRLLATATSG